MLAKIRTREHVRSSGNIFGGLSEYISSQSKALRIDYADGITSPETAAATMQALSDRRPRIRNPLHHHVLSWRPPDRLSNDAIMDCARRSLEALRLDPQRYLWIAAIHGDTDHQHVHVLANRIDPATLRGNTLRFGFATLDRFCREQERDHGWKAAPGSHVINADGAVVPAARRYADRSPISGPALDQEVRTGIESFQRWVGGAPAQAAAIALRSAPGWEALHQALAEFHIEYVPFAKGAAIRDIDDPTLHAKASHLGQNFNFRKLEQRLGAFIPAPSLDRQQPRTTYRQQAELNAIPMPWAATPDMRALRELYDRMRAEWTTTGRYAAQAERARVRAAGKARIVELKVERTAISRNIAALRHPVTPKSVLRFLMRTEVFEPDLAQIKAENRQNLAAVTAAHPHPHQLFRRWLMDRAKQKDAVAERLLALIRTTERSAALVASIDELVLLPKQRTVTTRELVAPIEIQHDLAAEAARLARMDALAEEALDAAERRTQKKVDRDLEAAHSNQPTREIDQSERRLG